MAHGGEAAGGGVGGGVRGGVQLYFVLCLPACTHSVETPSEWMAPPLAPTPNFGNGALTDPRHLVNSRSALLTRWLACLRE